MSGHDIRVLPVVALASGCRGLGRKPIHPLEDIILLTVPSFLWCGRVHLDFSGGSCSRASGGEETAASSLPAQEATAPQSRKKGKHFFSRFGIPRLLKLGYFPLENTRNQGSLFHVGQIYMYVYFMHYLPRNKYYFLREKDVRHSSIIAPLMIRISDTGKLKIVYITSDRVRGRACQRGIRPSRENKSCFRETSQSRPARGADGAKKTIP